jgi:FdhE protein
VTTEPGPADAFGRRAERAAALAPESQAAREPLEFAAGLYRVQGRMAQALAGRPLTGRLADDLPHLTRPLAEVRGYIAAHGPAPLAAMAGARLSRSAPDLDALQAWWHGPRSGAADYLARAELKAYAEVLAARGVAPEKGGGGCELCGGQPWIGWRRAPAPSEGALRFLGCALCGHERALGRICCPACGEEDPHKLPAFTSPRHPAVRLEACASCRRYLKSIDLTVDARVVPEVDDLVSIAMDLWAADEGWTRIEPGLAGV